MSNFISKLCMALVFVGGCGGNTAQDLSSISLDNIDDNGVQLNGITMNGVTLNGVTLNGVTLNGVTLNGVTLNGVTLNGITMNGSTLAAQRVDTGAAVSGKDFIGATLPVTLGPGLTSVLRLDDIQYNTTAGVNVYIVSMKNDAGWAPICGTLNDAPVPVVPVPGTWDLTTGTHTDDSSKITLGCVNTAIGKCVIWGYQPFSAKKECDGNNCKTQSLLPWLEACTRLVRADYCGEGVPHTRNGTPINVWDPLNIQTHATTAWTVEADWARDGAHCIKHTRWVQADLTIPGTDLDYVTKNCSSRLAQNDSANCGRYSDFTSANGLSHSTSKRNLLRNESALNQ